MTDTLLRQLTMLRQIPRAPRKVDAGTIHNQLAAMGYRIHVRSIQRDLIKLSTIVPLIADNAKPQGWSWRADTAPLDIPALDPQAALTFKLVEGYMAALLPQSTREYLSPWFNAAGKVLEQQTDRLGNWPDKIGVVPRGQPLLPPTIAPAVQNAVYQGLLEERRLTITYQTRGATETKEYEINPVALVVRDPVVYLVATVKDHDNPLHFLLHRMTGAQLLDVAARRPKGFDLDRHVNSGELGWPQGGTIRLVADFDRMAAVHLYETPLSQDQVISDVDENTLRVKASVVDTIDLRAWLRSFGSEVKVKQPAALARIL